MPTKTPSEIENLTAEVERLKSVLVALGTDLNRAKLMFFAAAIAQSPSASRAYDLCGLSEDQLRDRLASKREFLSSWELSAIERGLQSGRLVFSDFTQTAIDEFNWVLVCRKRGLWVPF